LTLADVEPFTLVLGEQHGPSIMQRMPIAFEIERKSEFKSRA